MNPMEKDFFGLLHPEKKAVPFRRFPAISEKQNKTKQNKAHYTNFLFLNCSNAVFSKGIH